MNAEIIAVGTELLMGQVVNTNATYLSRQLLALGIDVYRHTVVGDNAERLLDVLSYASKRSELIVLCGGIGPTRDDLTKQTVAAFADVPLVREETAQQRIEAVFAARQQPMPDNNLTQALTFKNGTAFPNDVGLAIGSAMSKDDVTYVVLPGPPSELQAMFERYVVPFLVASNFTGPQLHSRVLRFYGIGESRLVAELDELIQQQTNPTIAPYAKLGEVTLRLTANADNEDSATTLLDSLENDILHKVSDYFYGYGDDYSLPEAVINQLQQQHATLSVAESLTGGWLQSALVAIPGASEVFCGGVVAYRPEQKTTLLGVSPTLIASEGVVSAACAEAMARGVLSRCHSDYAVAVTGEAGPVAQSIQPVGTVYVAVVDRQGHSECISTRFVRQRNDNRYLAVLQACALIRQFIEQHPVYQFEKGAESDDN